MAGFSINSEKDDEDAEERKTELSVLSLDKAMQDILPAIIIKDKHDQDFEATL